MTQTRRQLLQNVALGSGAAVLSSLAATPAFARTADAAPAASQAAVPVPVPSTGAYLVLLGTAAGPVPTPGRLGISSALVVDGRIYLVDLGHGSFDQFAAAGLDIADLDHVFVTHLHSDHLADVYTLLWLRFGGINPLTHPLTLWGPGPAGALPAPYGGGTVPTVEPQAPTPGLADFISSSIAATAYDINLRIRDEGWKDIEQMYAVNEIPLPDVGASPTGEMAPPMQPFEVMSDSRVRVTAILVQHPSVFPSYAFRFDTAYGSITFSGDTTITQNMVTLAKGSDILVHEALDVQALQKAQNLSAAQIQHQTEAHSDVTKIGHCIAEPAGVRTLVLSHLDPGSKAIPDSSWQAKASAGFSGTVVVGNDLQRLKLS